MLVFIRKCLESNGKNPHELNGRTFSVCFISKIVEEVS